MACVLPGLVAPANTVISQRSYFALFARVCLRRANKIHSFTFVPATAAKTS